MIFLEQITNQILMEEGQIILNLSDLGITWEQIQALFIGTYEQAKKYLSIYDWEERVIGNQKQKVEYSHVKHITYNAYNNMQRFMPDVPQQYWEFNPYTKNISSLMNTNFSLEYGTYPHVDYIDYTVNLINLEKGKVKSFILPFTPLEVIGKSGTDEININIRETNYNYKGKNNYLEVDKQCVCKSEDDVQYELNGDVNGNIDPKTLRGTIKPTKNYDSLDLVFTSKYVGILELNMSDELFYQWYKGNLLTMIGSVKSQINVSNQDMPFDFTQDNLLERGRQILEKVEELKGTKQHWSNF